MDKFNKAMLEQVEIVGKLDQCLDQQIPLSQLPAIEVCLDEIQSWFDTKEKQANNQGKYFFGLQMAANQRIVSPLNATFRSQKYPNILCLCIQRSTRTGKIGQHQAHVFVQVICAKKVRANMVMRCLLQAITCLTESQMQAGQFQIVNFSRHLPASVDTIRVVNSPHFFFSKKDEGDMAVPGKDQPLQEVLSGLHYQELAQLLDNLEKEIVKAFPILAPQLSTVGPIKRCLFQPSQENIERVSECDIVGQVEYIIDRIVTNFQQSNTFPKIRYLSQLQLNGCKKKVLNQCLCILADMINGPSRDQSECGIIHQHPLTVMLPGVAKAIEDGKLPIDLMVYDISTFLPLFQCWQFFNTVFCKNRYSSSQQERNVGTLYALGQTKSGKSIALETLHRGVRPYQLQTGSYQNGEIVSCSVITADDTSGTDVISVVKKSNNPQSIQYKNLMDFNLHCKLQCKFKPDILCSRFVPLLIATNEDLIQQIKQLQSKEGYQHANVQSFFRRMHFSIWSTDFELYNAEAVEGVFCKQIVGNLNSADVFLRLRLSFVALSLIFRNPQAIDFENAGLSPNLQSQLVCQFLQLPGTYIILQHFSLIQETASKADQIIRQGILEASSTEFMGAQNMHQFLKRYRAQVCQPLARELDDLTAKSVGASDRLEMFKNFAVSPAFKEVIIKHNFEQAKQIEGKSEQLEIDYDNQKLKPSCSQIQWSNFGKVMEQMCGVYDSDTEPLKENTTPNKRQRRD